jgi:DNA invertase Pin-like site-specific DNA recombinase
MKRCLQLVRVSTKSQAADDRASISSQYTVNKQTAKAYGLEIVKTIEMADVSGSQVLKAPEMLEMLDLIGDAEIHGVITREFSRLMRPENFVDFAILQRFADTKTILYFPDGPMDLTSKSGRLMGTIKAAIAGMDRTEILERIWNAKEDKRRKGELANSRACLPFGVDWNRESGWSYTVDAERVRECFRMFLSGETSYWEIGRKLGLEPTNVKIYLRNPIYTGWRIIDSERDKSIAKDSHSDGRQKDRPKVKRSPENVIRLKVIDEGLISTEDFERAQSLMETKRVRGWRSNPDYEHRFTYNGFLNCDKCGGLIYSKFQRMDYYKCKAQYMDKSCDARSMRRERLDAHIDNLIATQLTDRDFLKQIAGEMKPKRASKTSRLEAEIETLRRKRSSVLDTYFEGVIDISERNERLTKIDAAIRGHQAVMSRPEPDISFRKLSAVCSVFRSWKRLDRDSKRKILASTIPSFRVADYQVSGLYLFSHQKSHADTGYFMAEPFYLPLPLINSTL